MVHFLSLTLKQNKLERFILTNPTQYSQILLVRLEPTSSKAPFKINRLLAQPQIYNKLKVLARDKPGNTKGGSITVPLTSCLTGLDESVLQIKTKIVRCHS